MNIYSIINYIVCTRTLFFCTGVMHFVRQLSNITRDSGKSVKLNCEVTGEPPPLRIQWYMNEVLVEGGDSGGGRNGNGEKKSKPRLTIKRFQSRHKNGLGSRLRINKLEVHHTFFDIHIPTTESKKYSPPLYSWSKSTLSVSLNYLY